MDNRRFAKVIVKNEKNEILLVKEQNSATRTWDFPGGKLEKSDFEHFKIKSTPDNKKIEVVSKYAAAKELEEETGIKIDYTLLDRVLKISHIWNNKFWSGYYFFLKVHTNNINIVNNDKSEISDIKFIPEGIALKMLKESYPVDKTRMLDDLFKHHLELSK